MVLVPLRQRSLAKSTKERKALKNLESVLEYLYIVCGQSVLNVALLYSL